MCFKKGLGMINRAEVVFHLWKLFTINFLCFVRLDSQSPPERLFPGDSGSMASHEKEQLWKVSFFWFHYDFFLCSFRITMFIEDA